MPGDNIKNRDKYDAMRDEEMSKEKAARMANSGKGSAVKGGKKELQQKADKVALKDAPR